MKTSMVGAMMKFHVVYMFWKRREDGELGNGWGSDERVAPMQLTSLEPLAEELKKEFGYEEVVIFNLIPLEIIGGSPIISGVR